MYLISNFPFPSADLVFIDDEILILCCYNSWIWSTDEATEIKYLCDALLLNASKAFWERAMLLEVCTFEDTGSSSEYVELIASKLPKVESSDNISILDQKNYKQSISHFLSFPISSHIPRWLIPIAFSPLLSHLKSERAVVRPLII